MGALQVVKEGYDAYRKSGGTKPEGITNLAADVQLTDYDAPGPVTKNNQADVSAYLMTLWPDVFNADGSDIAPPKFMELADGKTVVCLNVMGRHQGQDQHVCVDYVTVEQGKVTNIQCCIARHPTPGP
jgi:hypothetical protein